MGSDVADRVTGDEGSYALQQSIGRPRTILEIGAGVGVNTRRARRRGAHVVGLETDETKLAQARSLVDEAHYAPLDDLVASGRALAPIECRRFDLVVFGDSLERVRDADALLRRITPLLEDGGHVILSIGSRLRVGHEHDAPLAAAIERAEAAGLEVMRVDAYPPVVRSAVSKLGLKDDIESVDARRAAPKSAGGLEPRHVVKPLERLVGRSSRDAERVVIARVPPKAGRLSLTIGMLTLNEEKSVEQMIDDIRAVAPDAKIVLIDSSSDKTPELAAAKGARVVRQLPPCGHGPAMERLMYEAAKDTEALIYLDCDFTYPTATIPKIRALLESGADLVNASRTAKYPKAMPVPNFLANRFFAATAQVVHGVPTTDVHSGMRGYRASMVRAFDFDGSGDAIPLDTLIMPARSNYNVVEFPIDYAERVGESKLAKLRGTLWTFIRIAGAVGHGERVRSGRRYRVESA